MDLNEDITIPQLTPDTVNQPVMQPTVTAPVRKPVLTEENQRGDSKLALPVEQPREIRKEIPKSPMVPVPKGITPIPFYGVTSPQFQTPPEKPQETSPVKSKMVEKQILPNRNRNPPKCYGFDE